MQKIQLIVYFEVHLIRIIIFKNYIYLTMFNKKSGDVDKSYMNIDSMLLRV